MTQSAPARNDDALTPQDLAREIIEYAADRKAIDIVQLDLRRMIGYTDYFVICSGRTERQTKAIHDAIYEGLKSAHRRLPERVEGLRGSRWILMDYLDVVVHVFVPETREYYRLEQLWGEAPAHAVGAGSS
jgi:ribosome-associated protein